MALTRGSACHKISLVDDEEPMLQERANRCHKIPFHSLWQALQEAASVKGGNACFEIPLCDDGNPVLQERAILTSSKWCETSKLCLTVLGSRSR